MARGRDPDGCRDPGIGYSGTGTRGRPLPLPQLRQLQEHVVRVHARDDQAGHAVLEAAAQDVVAQERQGRVERQAREARARAFFVHLPRRQIRVPLHRLEMMRDVAIGVVLDLALERAGPSLDGHRLVHVPLDPPARAAVVEAELEVRVPVGGANPPAEVPRHPRNPVALVRRLALEPGLDLAGQRRRDPLVGVQREDPVVPGERGRVVLLRAVARPVPHEHPVGVPPRDLDRAIGAARVHDDDVVGPGDRVQGPAQVRLLVPGDDGHRELRHGGSLAGPEAGH